VNHVADWDPNYRNFESVLNLGPFGLPADDAEAARFVAAKVGVTGTPREVYRVSETELDVLYDRRTLHADGRAGTIRDEGQKPRFLVKAANWLHLNRGKKAWTIVADGYAAALLFLAVSGMFMLAGKKGLFGRGAFFVGIGVLIPVLYVAFAQQ
jgi:hypothetical protein